MNDKQSQHNDGQQDGAKATGLDAFIVSFNPFLSAEYVAGFRHAYNQQRPQPQPPPTTATDGAAGSTAKGGGGSGGGDGDGAEALLWVLLACAAVIGGPILFLIWAFKRPIRILVVMSYLSLLYAGFAFAKYGEKEIAGQLMSLGVVLFFPLIACAIGNSKKRPVLGFLLGLLMQPLGVIVIALVPEKEASDQAGQQDLSAATTWRSRAVRLSATAMGTAWASILIALLAWSNLSVKPDTVLVARGSRRDIASAQKTGSSPICPGPPSTLPKDGGASRQRSANQARSNGSDRLSGTWAGLLDDSSGGLVWQANQRGDAASGPLELTNDLGQTVGHGSLSGELLGTKLHFTYNVSYDMGGCGSTGSGVADLEADALAATIHWTMTGAPCAGAATSTSHSCLQRLSRPLR